jgi:4,5-DOPA dioxygenase extradiol
MEMKFSMPVLFIGHGSPMNAIEENEFHQTWQKIASKIPKPKAILSISAHWQSEKTAITGSLQPQTIHDFWGFPQVLFDVQYPAPGSKWLVDNVLKLSGHVEVDTHWGLDHGTWSVLHTMYPKADIPVVQLSLARNLKDENHYVLGQVLKPLRKKGVLILGSGNIVHNLRMAIYEDMGYDWALEFDVHVKEWIERRDYQTLVHQDHHSKTAELSINSAEHYYPLLYTLGASEPEEPIQFFCEKVTLGSISMRCVQFG